MSECVGIAPMVARHLSTRLPQSHVSISEPAILNQGNTPARQPGLVTLRRD